MIEILTTGQLNTIQDLGRPGYLAFGISHSGAMDRPALEVANLLLGNDRMAAGIEVAYFPFRARFNVNCNVAVTGVDCQVLIGDRIYPSWWAVHIQQGQTIILNRPRSGARAYLAFTGGIDVPLLMGSRATDVKSGFGGLKGAGLTRGDRLNLMPGNKILLPEGGLGVKWAGQAENPGEPPITIRVLPAAEFDDFTPESKHAFTTEIWIITANANRMGYHLNGSVLALAKPLELHSHGIVAGTVQVPRSGQPIIQLADANTCGGYPKIATVIDADLYKLAQASATTPLRFSIASTDEAVNAILMRRDAMTKLQIDLRLHLGY